MIYPRNRRVFVAYLMLLVVGVCFPFQSIQAKCVTCDPLWRKAVTIAAANKRWVPGFAILRIEVLNKHGKVEQVEEKQLEFIDLVTLNVVGTSPFEPEFQDEISVHPTGKIEDILEKECIRYEYVWNRQDETLTGIAWLEQETGIPVEIEFSSCATTQVSRGQHVTVSFCNMCCDAWFPLRMTMELEGGLLTLGRNFRITVDYKDYRKTE